MTYWCKLGTNYNVRQGVCTVTFMPRHFPHPPNNPSYSWPWNKSFSAKHKMSLFSGVWGVQRRNSNELSLLPIPGHMCCSQSPGLGRRSASITSAPEMWSGTNEKPNTKQVRGSTHSSLAWMGFNFCLQRFSFNSLNLGLHLGRTKQYNPEKQSKSDCQLIGRFHGESLNQH